ncbi:MAG: NADH:flavin oxidoreductase [bacterium]|nr:NADH:flavin oxidoreductase [bacterium]
MLLLQPIKIGKMELKNRIVMAPMSTNYAAEDGSVTEKLKHYLVKRAKGGVGLIIVESSYIDLVGKASTCNLGIHSDTLISGLSNLVDAVHNYDVKIAVQLWHAGRRTKAAICGSQSVTPSSISNINGNVSRELTIEEIENIVRLFGGAAKRAKNAGFDAIELHMAHGYLINQFLSPYFNRRTDKYGGNFQKRIRFAIEVVERIRIEVGDEFPILCRLSAEESIKGGLTIQEGKDIAKVLQSLGVSAIDVSGGISSSSYISTPSMDTPEGYLVHLAQAVKEVVTVPVIAVGRIHNPLFAESILKKGKADLIALGRALLADPEWPIKVKKNLFANIRMCLYCNYCYERNHVQLDIACDINSQLGKESPNND